MEEQDCACMESEESKLDCLHGLIKQYRGTPGALIPVLHQAQRLFGFLPGNVLEEVSRGLRVPISEVMGIVTFYSYFTTNPRGKNHVVVCTGTACYVQGAEQVLEKIQEVLGIEDGELSSDGLFSLQTARCFGACGLAPAVDVGGTVHRDMTQTKAGKMIEDLRKPQ